MEHGTRKTNIEHKGAVLMPSTSISRQLVTLAGRRGEWPCLCGTQGLCAETQFAYDGCFNSMYPTQHFSKRPKGCLDNDVFFFPKKNKEGDRHLWSLNILPATKKFVSFFLVDLIKKRDVKPTQPPQKNTCQLFVGVFEPEIFFFAEITFKQMSAVCKLERMHLSGSLQPSTTSSFKKPSFYSSQLDFQVSKLICSSLFFSLCDFVGKKTAAWDVWNTTCKHQIPGDSKCPFDSPVRGHFNLWKAHLIIPEMSQSQNCQVLN